MMDFLRKNKRADYVNALVTTILFVVVIWSSVFSGENNLFNYLGLIVVVGWLFFVIVKPAYKVSKGTANDVDMNMLKLAPLGFGLLRMRWNAYRQMAKKLASEHSLEECKYILANINRHVPSFERSWNDFHKEFCNIETSKENRGVRHMLVLHVLYGKIQYEKYRALEVSWLRLIDGLNIEGFKELGMITDLPHQLLVACTFEVKGEYAKVDAMRKVYKEEVEKRTPVFESLKRDLNDLNIGETFRKMYK